MSFAGFRCKSFLCGSSPMKCIDPDLVCDGVNHCGDNSDESFNLCASMLMVNDIQKLRFLKTKKFKF